MEPTKDQKTFLKSNALGTTMISVSGNDMTVGEGWIVVLLLVNAAFLGAMFYFLIWKRRDELLTKSELKPKCQCNKCHEEEEKLENDFVQEVFPYEDEQLFVPDDL
jgi:hypothetical protein